MKLSQAIIATFKSKRFWTWQLAGALIYAIPVLIRYGTGRVEIPILNFPGFWIGHIIPGNMLEKVLVNAFFPGGAGAITGEILFNNYTEIIVSGRKKYWARLGGALGQTALWSTFQFLGYFLMISGPGGNEGSNLFESIFVFPINFILAILSIFTPDILSFVALGVNKIRRKFRKTTNS